MTESKTVSSFSSIGKWVIFWHPCFTITTDCYETVSGMVTVECNGAMGISVFEAIAALTANDVFFFLTEAGGPPLPFNGANVTLTDGGS